MHEDQGRGLFDTDIWGSLFLIFAFVFPVSTLFLWAFGRWSLREAAVYGLVVGPGSLLVLYGSAIFFISRDLFERLRNKRG